MVELYWKEKNELFGKESVPVTLLPPQIPHGMARIEIEIRSENPATVSNDTEQSEVNNRCAL